MAVICVFGASSTWGAWDSEKGGWVNRLRLHLESKDYEVDVYNLGVSGDTTKDVLERFDVEAKAREPTLIIFSIGDNDSVWDKSQSKNLVSQEDFEKNIKVLVEKSKKFKSKVLFIGLKNVIESKTTPVSWGSFYYTNKSIKTYDAKLKKLTVKMKVPYLPVFGLLEDNDFSDGVHPNSQGHEKLFKEVNRFLVKSEWI